MRATDDGIWHECTEAEYRAHLASYRRRADLVGDPRPNETFREDLRRGFHEGGGGMWFVFNVARFERDTRHVKSEGDYKICWRIRDGYDGRWRFWAPRHWLMQRRGKNARGRLRDDKQA